MIRKWISSLLIKLLKMLQGSAEPQSVVVEAQERTLPKQRKIDAIRQMDEGGYFLVANYVASIAGGVDELWDVFQSVLEFLASKANSMKLDPYQEKAFFNCLQCVQYELIHSMLTAMRGHISDSTKYSRRAIESAAFACEVFRRPKHARIFLELGVGETEEEQKKHEEEYVENFKAFRKVERNRKYLGDDLVARYEEQCLFVHPSYLSLNMQASDMKTVDDDYKVVYHRGFFLTDVREERHFDHLAIHMINQLQLFRMIISAVETLADKVKQVKFSDDLKKEISEFDAKFMNLKVQWLKEAENLERDFGISKETQGRTMSTGAARSPG